jgi:SMC interacting uncharacterized protein involved in chromosome segregation
MEDTRKHVDQLLQDLKQERDELRVKVQLAKMEANDEWKEIEKKLVKLDAKAKELGSATADAAKDVGAAARLLGEEIRKGLKKVASHF